MKVLHVFQFVLGLVVFVQRVNLDVAILISRDQGVLALVQANCGDFVALGKLELVYLLKIHSQIELSHGTSSPVEGHENLSSLVAQDEVAGTVALRKSVLHYLCLLSKGIWKQRVIDFHSLLFLRNCTNDIIGVDQVKICHSRIYILI